MQRDGLALQIDDPDLQQPLAQSLALAERTVEQGKVKEGDHHPDQPAALPDPHQAVVEDQADEPAGNRDDEAVDQKGDQPAPEAARERRVGSGD